MCDCVNRPILALLWMCVLMCSFLATARSQPARIQIQTIALRGTTPTSFTANKDLRLYVDAASLSSVRSFQIRVFRGAKHALPSLGRLMPDGCLEYDTSVYEPHYRRGQIFVAQTDRSWLSSPDGQRYASGQFVLVFEVGAPRDTRIRIAGHDVENYFSRGIEIEVIPDAYIPERVAQEVQESNRRYTELVRRITSDVRGCLEVLETREFALFMHFASCSERLPGPDSTLSAANLASRMAAE